MSLSRSTTVSSPKNTSNGITKIPLEEVKESLHTLKESETQKAIDKHLTVLTKTDLTILAHLAATIGFADGLKVLISKGTDVNCRDETQETCLHKAASEGFAECVKLLLSLGGNIEAQDHEGARPLHIAISSNHLEVVELLLASGVDVNAQDSKGSSPLHYAIFDNSTPIISSLFNSPKLDVNVKDNLGSTALHTACFMGHLESVNLLLSHKSIDINCVDLTDSAPIHKATFNGNLDVVKALVSAGAVVQYDDGRTSPIHVAAFEGHFPVLEYLAQNGGNVMSQDAELATCLHKASFSGHLNVVKFLLDNGADIYAQDVEGCTALHKATFSGKPDIVEYLVHNGAEVDCQDNDDGTPLHNACFTGNLTCAKILLQNQANLNCADANGASPLHLSVLNGHLDVAKFLVDSGAQIDSPDDRGMTALHHAIAHLDCLSFLLECGAEIDVQDNAGRTPLFYASKNGCVESVRFLIIHGSDVNKEDTAGHTPVSRASAIASTVIQEALKEREQKLDSETQKHYKNTAKLFNKKPQTGIDHLKEIKLIQGNPIEVAKFLHTGEGLDKTAIGNYLGEPDSFNVNVLQSFVDYMDFNNLELDDALRHFLVKFTLPGEAQKIDRMMQAFAKRYVEHNPNKFPTEDTAYVLSFSLIMLNTDAHNPNIKNKMTKEGFIKNNNGIAGGKNLPRELLEDLYNRIVTNEIKMSTQGSVFTSAEKKGWCKKQGGRIKTWKKRYMVLKDNCLYYFKRSEDKDPYGIVPLENLKVRLVNNPRNAFELYSETNEVKSCKKTSNGQLVKGHHGSYLIVADSKEETESWVAAINNNIASNPILELIKKRIEETQNMRVSKFSPMASKDAVLIDFKELHDICMMCSMCYKTPSVIREVYAQSLVNEDSEKNLRYFFLSINKVQTIVIGGNPTDVMLSKLLMENHWGLDKMCDIVINNYSRMMKKETPVHIFGHSFGGALAVFLAQQLQSMGYKIEKLITFGQPKVIKENEINQFRSVPLLRVIDAHDPYFIQFQGHFHVGSEIVLLDDINYSYSSKHNEEAYFELTSDSNHVESYLRNLRHKMRTAMLIDDRRRNTLNMNNR